MANRNYLQVGLDWCMVRKDLTEVSPGTSFCSQPLLHHYLQIYRKVNFKQVHKNQSCLLNREINTMRQSHSHSCPSDKGIKVFLEDFQSFPLIPSLYMAVNFPLSLTLTWLPLLETAPVSCSAPWSKQATDTVFEGVFMWPSEESHVAPPPSMC